MSVPFGTTPGIYSGFIEATVGGSSIDIPIVITVPAKLGQSFTLQAMVMNEPRTGASGDWFYVPVQVSSLGPMMLTATWTTPDADFNAFLISPAGHVIAAAEAPPASLGYEWYTTTGTTMQMLSIASGLPGYWYVGIEALYFGNTFSQSVTLNLGSGVPINTPNFISLTSGTSRTFTVSNNIPGDVDVQAMALSFAIETYAIAQTGNVTSYRGPAPAPQGYDILLIPVTPDMITMTVTLSWVGSHSLSLILADPFGGTNGLTSTNGGSLTVVNPAIGYWAAIITINDVGSQLFTLTIGGLAFQQLAGVTIAPNAFTLAPKGTQTLTISAATSASGIGRIVYFDMSTGSTYPSTLLAIIPPFPKPRTNPCST